MKARAEAIKLITEQMDGPEFRGYGSFTKKSNAPKGGKHHYGYQELRDLLDFIYEGAPKEEAEKLLRGMQKKW